MSCPECGDYRADELKVRVEELEKQNEKLKNKNEELKHIIENLYRALDNEPDKKINELEKQNEELIKLLVYYIDDDYKNGTDDLTWQAIEYIQEIKGKTIEEIIKEYE